MSILPSQNQVSSESCVLQTSQNININSNHGSNSNSNSNPRSCYQLQQWQQHPTANDSHYLQIRDSTNFSEQLAHSADDYGPSSKKVNQKSWTPRSGKSSSPYDYGRKVSPSQETSAQGKPAGIAVNPTTLHTPASTSGQGNTKNSASARKSQVVSGNHLLNFQYDPISRPHHRARARPPPRRQPKRKPYNKDLFLQANYKFVVLDTGDYTPESMDPDQMLRWEDIICFKYLSPFPVRCPICLGDPLCPQITSCGHIFCFPCILQYFLMDRDDHKADCWKKCPLCFTMISSQDLYTIYIESVKRHSVGDIIEFILLTREKDSYTPSLKNNEGLSTNEKVLDSFSKFTLTSDVELSVREAMSDLDNWLARADSGLVDDLEKLPYVCAAMEQLEKRRKYWSEHRVPDGSKARSSHMTNYGSPPIMKSTNAVNTAKEVVKGAHSSRSNDKSQWLEKSPPDKINGKSHVAQTADIVEQTEDHDGSSSSSYDDNTNTLADGPKDVNDRDSYSFYQTRDGQLIILHSINMKCLLNHYGTFDRLPNRINGKILQLETVTQSETTRKRFRYLSHFSLTTSFQLCEIDLRELLPTDAFSPFMDEIKNREKERKRLARKERQEKIKAEAVGLDLVPIPYNVAQSSFDESPTFSMDDFEALGSSTVSSTSTIAPGGRQLFSSVARLGFAAGHDSPAINTEESQSLPRFDTSGGVSVCSRSFASITSRTKPDGQDRSTTTTTTTTTTNKSGKKGRKPSRVLLSTSGGRRY